MNDDVRELLEDIERACTDISRGSHGFASGVTYTVSQSSAPAAVAGILRLIDKARMNRVIDWPRR